MNGSEAQETLAAAMECHNVLDLDMTTFERPVFSTLPENLQQEYINRQQRATRIRYNVRWGLTKSFLCLFISHDQ